MSEKISHVIWVAIFSLAFVGVAHAQHDLQRTVTVDQSGRADETSIQVAIDSITPGGDRWTVLIYAGEYDEAVTLDGADEGIDLVGIDRDAVIIAPSSGDGIVITSGTETSRNNSIRNLTIKTADGIGIKIVHGGTPVPKNIVIEGVTIEVAGTDMDGINAEDVELLRVSNVSIQTTDGHGISFVKKTVAPTDIIIERVTIQADGTTNRGIEGDVAQQVRVSACQVTSDDGDGIRSGDDWTIEETSAVGSLTTTASGFLVRGDNTVMNACSGKGKLAGLKFGAALDGVNIVSSFFHGGTGVHSVDSGGTKNVFFRDCHLLGDHTLDSTAHINGLITDGNGNDNVQLKGCRIEAISDGKIARAVWHDVGTLVLEDCTLIANNLNEDLSSGVGTAVGITGGNGKTIIGCTFETSSAAEETTDVWDVRRVEGTVVSIARCTFSKWKGPITSAGRARTVTQRLLNVTAADADILVNDGDLDGNPITVASPDLATYRTVQVTWNSASGDDITVVAAGTNWADDAIAESFVLSTGTPQKDGDKPFKTVTKIYIPDAPGSIDVGTTDKLGLYCPLSATTDVIQEAKLVSNVYTTQSVGTVDAVYSTIIPSSALTFAPSFEWMLLTSP